MNKLNQWIVLAIGMSALALAILIGSSPIVRASQGASDVNVVNPSLPVSGTVIASQASGQTYLVSVANSSLPVSGSVTASQPAGAAYRVEVASQPMFRQRLGIVHAGDVLSWTNTSDDVAVITQVNGFNNGVSEALQLTVYETFSSHTYLFRMLPDPVGNSYTVQAQTTIFVPPGAFIQLHVADMVELTGHFEATAPERQ